VLSTLNEDLQDGRRRLERRFRRLAMLWATAFASLVVLSLVGFGVAESAAFSALLP
jgi:hypothetical protein